jgi:hypothetical protein
MLIRAIPFFCFRSSWGCRTPLATTLQAAASPYSFFLAATLYRVIAFIGPSHLLWVPLLQISPWLWTRTPRPSGSGSTLLLKMSTLLRPKLPLHSAVYRPPACSWRRNRPPPPMSNGRPPPPKGSSRPPHHPQLCPTWSMCRLRLGTRHQPPHLGHGSSERLPTGERRAGHYVHQLCHLA